MLRRSTRRLVTLPPCAVKPQPYTGPSKAEVAAQRKQYMNPVSFTYYKEPLMLVEGSMQYVFDEQGARYLDLFGGVTTVSVGHSHPRITQVVQEQTQLINHTTLLYLNPQVGDFCEAFAKKLPGNADDWRVHVVNSGSEANDFAMLMARHHTKNYPVMSVRNGYHGFSEGSRGLISVPGWKHPVPAPAGQLKALCPHPYHGILGTSSPDPYVRDAKDLMTCESGGHMAAFIAERIQGVGGAATLIPGYLTKMRQAVHEAGGLYISDEVQCGYGRLGSHYWGFEHEGIVPDIVTSAKSVANGWTVGVVAARKEVAESMKGTLYFNTFGGNAICSAVAHETLKIIDDEKLQANAKARGDQIKAGLAEIQKAHPLIADIRGEGLMLGFELIRDGAPAAAEAGAVLQGLKDEGILVGKGGPAGNVIRVHPPMCINEADVNVFLEATEKVVKTL